MHFPLLSTQPALDIKIVFYNAVELGGHSSPGNIITTQKKGPAVGYTTIWH